jgi:hypothetical protein
MGAGYTAVTERVWEYPLNTQQVDSSGRASDLYEEGNRFEARQGLWQSRLTGFQCLITCGGKENKIGLQPLPYNSFKFIIHLTSTHSKLYEVVKWPQINGSYHQFDGKYPCLQPQRLRWSRASVLAFRTKTSRVQTRPKPSDFSGRKKKSSARLPFGREVKPWVPCRRFTACKRSLNATWKSGIFRLNLPGHFSST